MTLNEYRNPSTDGSRKWKWLIPALPMKRWRAGKASILRNFGAGLVEFRFSALKKLVLRAEPPRPVPFPLTSCQATTWAEI